MSTKFVRRVLKTLLYSLLKLIKIMTGKSKDKLYTFKPFTFMKIEPKQSLVPFPRSGHRIGTDVANFYSFGGYNPVVPSRIERTERQEDRDFHTSTFPLFQELWRFNYATMKWFRYPNGKTLPSELASNALLLQGNLLMVYGGTGSPFGYRCSNQLYFCCVSDEQAPMQELHTTGQLPEPLYGQALVYHNGCLYTIGGTTGLEYTCDIHRLNLKTRKWESVYIAKGLSNEPSGRYRHEVAFDGVSIYVLGGGTVEEAFDFQDIPVFNIETKEWSKIHSSEDPIYGVPAPRLCHGCVQLPLVNGKIEVYITGGYDGERLYDDLWRLELPSMQWTRLAQCRLPTPVYFHAVSASPEGKLCVFGGLYMNMSDEATRSNSIHVMWLGVPKLSEICWEAVLHYWGDRMQQRTKAELLTIGLPDRFVMRLDSPASSVITSSSCSRDN